MRIECSLICRFQKQQFIKIEPEKSHQEKTNGRSNGAGKEMTLSSFNSIDRAKCRSPLYTWTMSV